MASFKIAMPFSRYKDGFPLLLVKANLSALTPQESPEKMGFILPYEKVELCNNKSTQIDLSREHVIIVSNVNKHTIFKYLYLILKIKCEITLKRLGANFYLLA